MPCSLAACEGLQPPLRIQLTLPRVCIAHAVVPCGSSVLRNAGRTWGRARCRDIYYSEHEAAILVALNTRCHSRWQVVGFNQQLCIASYVSLVIFIRRMFLLYFLEQRLNCALMNAAALLS